MSESGHAHTFVGYIADAKGGGVVYGFCWGCRATLINGRIIPLERKK